MNCAELDALLCDYLDGTLGGAQKELVERHLAECASCAELTRDAAAAVSFMGRAAGVEPPPELITRILFELSAERGQPAPARAGAAERLRRWFQPVLQPRFAMGMAMTILSFSMLGRLAGINIRQLKPSDLDPAKVWAQVDDRAHKAWNQVVKFYDSLRLVYEVRSRLSELTAEETREAGKQSVPARPAGKGSPPAGQRDPKPGP